MSFSRLIESFPWTRYSKKLQTFIRSPHSCGFFTEKESNERNMFLATGKAGDPNLANFVIFYFLIDPEDGKIVDTKFQVFGPSSLIGASEILCRLSIGKNYDQVKRMTTELIEKQVKEGALGFPTEVFSHLNLVLEASDQAMEKCLHIPLSSSYVAPPVSNESFEHKEYPGFDTLSKEQKISLIEQVLQEDIRPYIELDAGGVIIKDLNLDDVIITYQGSCTSCYSATGATLSYIQQVLQAKISPKLKVIPDIASLYL